MKQKKIALAILCWGYFCLLLIPLYLLFFQIFWIPFIWTAPAFIILSLEVFEITYFIRFRISIKNDPPFTKKEIIPLLKDYCSSTNKEYSAMTTRAEELELYFLQSALSDKE